MNPSQHIKYRLWNRRDWLAQTGMGIGSLALATLLSESPSNAAVQTNPLSPKKPHFTGKAKRVIHLFMEGGPSHLDTFDPKPELVKQSGKDIKRPHEEGTGTAYGSPFRFPKAGKSGIEISEVFPQLAGCADDLCVIRSLHTDDPGHEPAMLIMNCGDARLARPSVGSWVTYGLGSMNQNLPGFVVLYQDGLPLQGNQNWQSAFLPGVYQGTAIDTQYRQIDKLIEYVRSPHSSEAEQNLQLDLLREINKQHGSQRSDDSRLEARIQSFELAYRMQTEATDAFDINKESKKTREMYGNTNQGRQCLIARRLIERGVRFVQMFHSVWDHHENIAEGLKEAASAIDQAQTALLKDLKQRGLLEDTLVLWSGEFGRTPTVDGSSVGKKPGRDHNHRGFSCWLAGGGIRGGHVHGATDEFGFAAVEKKVHIHDLHATLLHLLGFHHEKLTYRYAGRDFRLTDVHGEVIKEILV